MNSTEKDAGLYDETDLRYVKDNISYYSLFMNGFAVLTKSDVDLLTPIELRRFVAAMVLKKEWEEKAISESRQR